MKPVYSDVSSPLGIVAGWGSFPVQVAEACRERGQRVIIAALKHHADPRLVELADELRWFGVCRLGGQMRFLRRRGVKTVMLAGKLFKDRILYHGLGWLAHSPDLTCLRTLYPNFISRTRDTTDDSVLGAIVKAFMRQGMQVLPATEFAPDLMAPAGCLSVRLPNSRERGDIEFGWCIAKNIGGLDIGQSVTVRDQTILAVEAVEGTDGLIERSARLCPRGGFSLVKVAKPQQDMRFDVPTIGLRTLELLYRAGGRVIAIEASKTILVDRAKTLTFANTHGMTIVALHDPAASLPLQWARAA